MKIEIEIERTYLKEIPHEKGSLTFQYPVFKGTFGSVAEEICNESLTRPTSPETASLIYDAFQNKDGKYESEIIQILKDAWFLEFTGNLYLPRGKEDIQNGVILEYNPTIENGKLIMDKSDLIKRLQNNDSLVKFVPFGYKTEAQNAFKLAKNPYIIARYGEEGAEKIAEIASNYKKEPYLWSFDSVDEEKVRMSALDVLGYFDGRLLVSGCNWVGGDGGHAFGLVSKK